jgi:transposase
VEISRIAKWTKLKPHTLEKQYKEHLSEFNIWKNGVDAEALVYAENFGEKMSIDETSLQNGEVYTVITNKAAHGKKGALAALIKGTKNEFVTKALGKVPIGTLMRVKEISADFANSMDWICRTNFPNAIIIGDRFHAQQIVSEGVQEIRIALRRKAIDEENKLIEKKLQYIPERYVNGDTKKQLLARSRYLLFKPASEWIVSQKERAAILFDSFPELKEAYNLSMLFRNVFEHSKSKDEAKEHLEGWLEKTKKSSLPTMVSVGDTINNNSGKILNYFPNRVTNAAAESFNAKLKGFKSLVRGIRDEKFFLFRIQTFYA